MASFWALSRLDQSSINNSKKKALEKIMSSLLVWCWEDKAVQSNRHNQGELYLFRYLLFTRSHVCEAQVALKMSPDPPLTSAEQKMSWHFSFEVSLQDWVCLLRRKKKSLCSRRHICLRSTSQQKRNFLVLLYLRILFDLFLRWPSVYANAEQSLQDTDFNRDFDSWVWSGLFVLLYQFL